MKKIIIRTMFMLLLLTTFAIIFKFSSQISEESDGVSNGVLRKIIEIFPYTKGLSEEIKIKMVEHGSPIIRKLAHFSIYTLVGV